MVNTKQELQNPSEYSLSNKCNSGKYGAGATLLSLILYTQW